jgi:hypothetical protein
VLLKFLNPSGYELGSAVVSLTHLLHSSTEEVHATEFSNVSARFVYVAVWCVDVWICMLASGGQICPSRHTRTKL